MDWSFIPVVLAVMLPFIILSYGAAWKKREQDRIMAKRLMARVGIKYYDSGDKNKKTLFEQDKDWFVWFFTLFKKAGLSKQSHIIKFLSIQLVLLLVCILLFVLKSEVLRGQDIFILLLVPFAPLIYLAIKIKQRQKELRQQFPEMLDSIVRSLQSGLGIDGAMAATAKEMHGPLAEEMNEINKQLTLGISMREVLREFQRRVSLSEAQFFVITLIIQRETGGQLVAILTELSKLMRRRTSFQAKLNTLTAESRFTAWFIGGAPILYIVYKYLFDRASLSFFLEDPTGTKLFAFALIMICTGALVLTQMLKMRF